MTTLYLMTMRADIQRDQPGAGLDPFNQAERGQPAPTAENVPCELFAGDGDIIVNGRRVAARILWLGIIDARAAIRAGDRLANVRKANGDPLLPANDVPPAHGGPRPLSLRVLRAAPVPGHHTALTLEALTGVTDG